MTVVMEAGDQGTQNPVAEAGRSGLGGFDQNGRLSERAPKRVRTVDSFAVRRESMRASRRMGYLYPTEGRDEILQRAWSCPRSFLKALETECTDGIPQYDTQAAISHSPE